MADQIKRINVIAEFTAKTKELDQKVDRIKKNVTGLSGFFKQAAAAAAGLFAVAGVTQFIRGISALKREVVDLADQQLKAEAKLLQALKGRQDLQQKLLKQASQLQEITLFGDEQTIEAQSRLAALLGDQEGAIERLIPLVQDFATAKQVDLATAAELVAKSVGSQTNALSRYGIQIEGAVGSTERLDSAVNALNRQFGGQAKAAFDAGAGALQAYDNLVGDLREEIGKRLLPVVNKWAERQSEVVKSLIRFVQIPVAEKLKEERTEVNRLVLRITSLNEGNDTRTTLIQQLNREYPDFLQNLDEENVLNKDLATRLSQVNDEYLFRIVLARKTAEIEKAEEKIGKVYDTVLEQQDKVNLAINQLNDELELGLDLTGKTTAERQKLFNETIREIIKTTALTREQTLLRIQATGIPLKRETELFEARNETIKQLREEKVALVEKLKIELGLNDAQVDRLLGVKEVTKETKKTEKAVEEVAVEMENLDNLAIRLAKRFRELPKQLSRGLSEEFREGEISKFILDLEKLAERAAQAIEPLVDDVEKLVLLIPKLDIKIPPPTPEEEIVIPTIEEQLNELANSVFSVTNAFSDFYQFQIDAISGVIDARRDEISQFKSLAERGNAEQLQLEEERLNNLIGLRERFQQRQAALNAAAIAGAQSVAAAGAIKALFDPEVPTLLRIANALAAVGAIGTIISAVNSAFGSIPSFAEGEEYLTGRPGSGIPIIAHEGERIVPKSVNKTLAGIPNTMLPEMAAFYQRFNPTVNQDVMMSMKGNDDLLIEMKGLRREMKMMRKKGTNLNLEVNVRADESKKRAAILK